jgi:hypothetical protein
MLTERPTRKVLLLVACSLALLGLEGALVDATALGPVPVADHYKVYDIQDFLLSDTVALTDQFGPLGPLDVTSQDLFSAPVEKTVLGGNGTDSGPIIDPLLHYTWTVIDDEVSTGPFQVGITNQFTFPSSEEWTVNEEAYLLSPTAKARCSLAPNRYCTLVPDPCPATTTRATTPKMLIRM